MPLELRPLEEADLDAYQEIMWEAFKPAIMGVMYPNGFSKEAREHSKAASLKAWRKRPDEIKKLKVVDTDLPLDDPLNGIVGVSDWNFFPHQRSEEELEQAAAAGKDKGFPPGANEAMMKDFFTAIRESVKQYRGGESHILLHILCTHPKHHRRGVGQMQLRWGFEQADKLGLPLWLEASPLARPLYERVGFETQGWLKFDARKWGREEDLPHAIMMRPAVKQGNGA